MGTNEYSQPSSKSSWDSHDFGDVNMVVKMAHFHKSSRPQWVKGPIDKKSSLVQIMAWHLKCNKPLPEPMSTWPQWVKYIQVVCIL